MDIRQDENDDWLDAVYTSEPPASQPTPFLSLAGARHIAASPRAQHERDSLTMPTAATLPAVCAPSASGGAPMPHKAHPFNFPGFIARSAMFSVTRTNEILDDSTPIHVAGGSMRICGPMLCMRDKAVWEVAIQIAKERSANVADAFVVELRDLSRRMGSSNHSGKALDSIWASLERLAKARVEFEIDKGRCKGVGSLLASAIKKGGRVYLRLNPDFAIAALTGDKQFRFDMQRRNSLASSLAQWLHDYYTTHKRSEDIDLKYLRGLCGYGGVARNFPTKLREAMDELLSKAPGLITSYSIIQASRSSDAWKLHVAFGTETPTFLPAARPLSLPPAARKGGVAL